MTDTSQSTLIDRLASDVGSGREVDWSVEATQALDETERRLIANLRAISKIARINRAPEAARPAGPSSGETWKGFTLKRELGRGAFGSVYQARDAGLERDVALKLIPLTGARESARERILREGRLLARVHHPNVVTIHGVEIDRDTVGFAMELVEGRTLEQELETRGPFSSEEASQVGVDLCRALAAVHAQGLLHRDVKAHNVMRAEGGRIVLMDFGAGSDLKQDSPPGRAELRGTPLYLAPEVFSGHEPTRASDIYSLGVLLYHLVTASYPVAGRTRDEVKQALDRGERISLRDARPDLPETFVRIVERAIDPDPARRYRSAGAFAAALAGAPRSPVERLADWLPHIGRSATSLVGAGALIVLVLMTAWWLWPATAPLAVEMAFHQRTPFGEVELTAGDAVAPGDELFLTFSATRPLYVYVINEDEQGQAFLLFPLPGHDLRNPLSPDTTHRLPGSLAGEENDWQVTSVGGREHFYVLASPTRLEGLEARVADLPVASAGEPVMAAPLPPEAVGRLRGVGGEVPVRPGQIPQRFSDLIGEGEELVSEGVWMRHVVLENPGG